MNSIERNFPCRCGHEDKFHESVGAPIWEQWCVGEDFEFPICQCSLYVPDNLKYLEEQYSKKAKLGNK